MLTQRWSFQISWLTSPQSHQWGQAAWPAFHPSLPVCIFDTRECVWPANFSKPGIKTINYNTTGTTYLVVSSSELDTSKELERQILPIKKKERGKTKENERMSPNIFSGRWTAVFSDTFSFIEDVFYSIDFG